MKCGGNLWSQANRDNVLWSVSSELRPNKWAAKWFDGAIGRLLVSWITQLLLCIENSGSDLRGRCKSSLVFSQLHASIIFFIFLCAFAHIKPLYACILCFSTTCLDATPAEANQCTMMTLENMNKTKRKENKDMFDMFCFVVFLGPLTCPKRAELMCSTQYQCIAVCI